MLWTALRYPLLPLERQGRVAADRPRVAVAREGARRLVRVCDAAACARGVRPGLPLGNALALVPTLLVEEIDESGQAAQLEQLTLQALGCSSRVTPCPPDTVLLEVQGSLRLFGGLDALLERLRSEAVVQGLTLALGTAPTPTAARLLARAGREAPVTDVRALADALAGIRLEHLADDTSALDARAYAALRRAGLRRVGQLMALPPAALARRFGPRLGDLLRRLDGRLPDPQTTFVPPATFFAAAELPLEAADAGALAFVLRRLFGALGGFLGSRDLGARALELRLHHRRLPPSVVALRLVEPSADVAHLHRIATERLGGTALVAPVTRLTLEATTLGEVARAAPALIDGGERDTTPIEVIVDRLVARLGERAVYTALAGDDHRPEKAWSAAPVVTGGASRSSGSAERPSGRWPPRPLLLLREPRVATEPLVLGPDPERIETGWWGATDVRRDYFIARDARGAYYWVFRLRRDPERVWIHGLFA